VEEWIDLQFQNLYLQIIDFFPFFAYM